MVEKTDSSKKASERSQAGKKAKSVAKRTAKKAARKTASKAKKTAARKSEVKKPAARKGRKRAATAVVEDRAIAKEELAARRIAGGQDTETAGTDDAAEAAPGTTSGATPDPTPDPAPREAPPNGGQPEAVGRVPESTRRGKAEPRTRAGENAEGSPRPNTLVPTNGIHTTERRLKRSFYQNRGVMGLIAATLLGIIILGEQTTPPDMTDFEHEIAASQAIETDAGIRVANPPPGIIKPKPRDEAVALPGPGTGTVPEQQNKNLNDGELVEMERLLARLDLGPSTADGIVDNQTEAAIRLYQEIAGLPIDGAPSRSLLADIREVVKILEDGG